MENDVHDDPAESHAVELTVWDVPATALPGERFAVTAGARCAAGCDLGGRELMLFDPEGTLRGRAQLGHAIWPGTEALHFARIEASAPLEIGSREWQARIDGWEAERPHAPGSFPLIVRVLPAPDCEVLVKVVDSANARPVADARVVMHPYRAVTDDNGVARIGVAKGAYDILVSGSQYQAACLRVDVSADTVLTAELEADRPWTSADEELE